MSNFKSIVGLCNPNASEVRISCPCGHVSMGATFAIASAAHEAHAFTCAHPVASLTLTDKERVALTNMGRSGYGNPMWDWCATGGIVTRAGAGGVIASLSRKGLVCCSGYGDEATIEITPAGLAIMTENGIAHDFD